MGSLQHLQDIIRDKYNLEPSALDPHKAMREPATLGEEAME